MEPSLVTTSEKRNNSQLALANRKKSIKKALTYHLSGLGEKTGLVFRALEKASNWLDHGTDEQQGKAMDIVIKLLPYVLEKEGQVTSGTIGPNGQGVINVQINNFDTFIKDRLSHTNLGKLLQGIDLGKASNVGSQIEEASFVHVTPPPGPGDAPGSRLD